MEFKITSESKEKAKEVFQNYWHSLEAKPPECFAKALDALCVPVQEEGWVPCVGHEQFRKGIWILTFWRGPEKWELQKIGDPCDCLLRNKHLGEWQIPEAKVWADAEIAKYEAAQVKKQPKPFGPGTKLRAPNGDTVMVITDRDGDYRLINLTKYEFIIIDNDDWWNNTQNLRAELESADYQVIDEEE